MTKTDHFLARSNVNHDDVIVSIEAQIDSRE